MNAIKLVFAFWMLVFSSWVLAAVNLNTATAEELEGLTGIGPAKAMAIVAYRKANGPFATVADLSQVKGIGEKTVKALAKDIEVSPKSVPAK